MDIAVAARVVVNSRLEAFFGTGPNLNNSSTIAIA